MFCFFFLFLNQKQSEVEFHYFQIMVQFISADSCVMLRINETISGTFMKELRNK